MLSGAKRKSARNEVANRSRSVELHLAQLVHVVLLFSAFSALFEVGEDVVERESVGRDPGQKLLAELVEDAAALHIVPLDRLLADKGPRTHLSFDETGELELGVGAADRIGVDGEIDRELANCGQPVAGRDGPGRRSRPSPGR